MNIQSNISSNIDNAFKHTETKKVAKTLVDMIVRNEDLENIDECIEAIWTDVCVLKDKQAGLPASAFIIAELFNKLRCKMKKSRYYVRIIE